MPRKSTVQTQHDIVEDDFGRQAEVWTTSAMVFLYAQSQTSAAMVVMTPTQARKLARILLRGADQVAGIVKHERQARTTDQVPR